MQSPQPPLKYPQVVHIVESNTDTKKAIVELKANRARAIRVSILLGDVLLCMPLVSVARLPASNQYSAGYTLNE